MGKWKCANIGSFADVRGGKRLPKGELLSDTPTGHPYIRVVDFVDGRISTENIKFVPDVVYPSIRRYTVNAGDVVVSIVGTIGLVAEIKPELAGANLTENAAKIVVKDNHTIVSSFLAYFLKSQYGQSEIAKNTVGSTQLKLPLYGIKNIEVPLPSIDEQRAIAHILGTLDDKIELNRKMNRTLEAIARAIFKSWFVDFDPVRAKAEGRDPGLPKEIADLFPDEFEESEIGEIPKGWKIAELGDVVEILDSRRVPLSARERAKRQGPYPYYGAAGVLDHVDEYLFEGVHVLMGEDGSVIDENDHPFVQYVWGQFWVNNHAHVLRGTSGISNEYLFLFLKQVNIRPYVTGAVQPKLNQRNLKSIPFVKPPQNICTVFSNLTDALFARLRSNTDECVTLSRLRDTLLPKLISGELRVPDAERILEANA